MVCACMSSFPFHGDSCSAKDFLPSGFHGRFARKTWARSLWDGACFLWQAKEIHFFLDCQNVVFCGRRQILARLFKPIIIIHEPLYIQS